MRFPSYFISLTVAAYLGWCLAARPRRNAMWYKVEFKVTLIPLKNSQALSHFKGPPQAPANKSRPLPKGEVLPLEMSSGANVIGSAANLSTSQHIIFA